MPSSRFETRMKKLLGGPFSMAVASIIIDFPSDSRYLSPVLSIPFSSLWKIFSIFLNTAPISSSPVKTTCGMVTASSC
jgi:hypothetical protein